MPPIAFDPMLQLFAGAMLNLHQAHVPDLRLRVLLPHIPASSGARIFS